MKQLVHTIMAVGSLCLASASASAAVTLVVEAGKLAGARNVMVGGVAYDVSFQDGTCTGLFSGCDAPGDFTFPSNATANAAITALNDTVLLDSALAILIPRLS